MKQGHTMLRIALTLFGAIHLVVAIWHGATHRELAVALSPAQNLFVYAVSVFAPLVAVGLLCTRYIRLALWLFLTALCAFTLLWHLLPLRVVLCGQHPPSSIWDCRDSCTLCTQRCDPWADRAGLSPYVQRSRSGGNMRRV